jgi:hypothetical protein
MLRISVWVLYARFISYATLNLRKTIEFAAPRSSLRKEYMSDQARMSQLRSIGESAQIHPESNEHLTMVSSYINAFEGAE